MHFKIKIAKTKLSIKHVYTLRIHLDQRSIYKILNFHNFDMDFKIFLHQNLTNNDNFKKTMIDYQHKLKLMTNLHKVCDHNRTKQQIIERNEILQISITIVQMTVN